MASKYDKAIKQRVVFDYESGMLIKEIVDKYKIQEALLTSGFIQINVELIIKIKITENRRLSISKILLAGKIRH